MRASRFALLIAVSLTLPMLGREVPTLSSISPSQLLVQSGEWFITLQGTHYLPSGGVQVIFSGPAGTIALAPNASTDTNMVAWLPLEVVGNPGLYSVKVRVPNGASTLDSNTVSLRIQGNSLVLKVPKLVLAEAINVKGGPATFDVTATSFLSDQVTVDCSARSGDFFPFQDTVVTCKASDDQGGGDDAEFTIRVADTMPPAFEVPKDLLAFGKSDGATVDFSAKASDLVDGEAEVTCAPKSGSFFRVGTSAITCATSDRTGNKGETTFRVHVGTEVVPALVIPESVTGEAESPEGAKVPFEAKGTIASGAAAEVKCDPGPGSLFPLGTTSVKCIAWGPGGESATDFFPLTVADTKGPVLDLPRETSAQAPSPEGAYVRYSTSAKDAVDGETSVVCFPASGELFAPGQTVVSCSSSDKAKNVSTGSFTVDVLPWVDEVTEFSFNPGEGDR